MPYIKKLVMKGFKSFPKETEILLDKSMNVIVGPNGSGKSNITDAICFVLGRLSIKSMRAEKTSGLIFAGTKEYKPVSEASVNLVFDNSDKKFPFPENEVSISRIARNNGQSIYKINNEVKTRQEVLELLATSGIDPYGFNIVLQGEIDSLVKMHAEERRKVIEEVAGISIYEIRKVKSLHELEKTEERLKDVLAVLRERNSYLKNLEEERKQALKFQKLQENEKRFKASIIKRKLDEKLKELSSLEQQYEEKDKTKKNLKEKELRILAATEEMQKEIEKINLSIQKASGIEQSELQNKISDIRAELAGLEVTKENNNSQLQELAESKQKAEQDIKVIQEEIKKFEKDSPSKSLNYKELEKKKLSLNELERQRKIFYNFREKLNSSKERINDKEKQLEKATNEINFLLKDIDIISELLSYKDLDSCKSEISKLKDNIKLTEKSLEFKEEGKKEQEKLLITSNLEIANHEKIKKQVASLDICPLCKSKITEEHIHEVHKECDEKISFFKKEKLEIDSKIDEEIAKIKETIISLENKAKKAEIDLIKLENTEGKKEQIKRLAKEQELLKSSLIDFNKEKESIEKKLEESKNVEENYDKLLFEVQDLSSVTKENLDSELAYKAKDLERVRMSVKQSIRDEETITQDLSDVMQKIETLELKLEEKEKEEHELEKKYQKLLDRKSGFEKDIHTQNISLFELRSNINNSESEINNLKIIKARLDAEKQNLETDFSAFSGIETINLPLNMLDEKLRESQVSLQSIGPVNLRALEVYDKIKEEYDSVAEKVTILESEKLEILKIIEEIDKKKKKTFTRTLDAINELFNRNFTQLSVKGAVSLEPENPDDIFAAGLDILVKVGKGKYFDVTSLSGGEQTLVALSLIFAIQEYKPYSFYIFDEVDAALDKRNSERLASLVKRYMKTGQYIIVTHNDAIITESSLLYGVSMQEGISKILSLEI